MFVWLSAGVSATDTPNLRHPVERIAIAVRRLHAVRIDRERQVPRLIAAIRSIVIAQCRALAQRVGD